MTKKISPLKFLATLHREMKAPTKVVPKAKTVVGEEPLKEIQEKIEVIKPSVVEILPAVQEAPKLIPDAISVKDSTFILNFNFNFDPEVIRAAMENSAKLVSRLAAGAAVLGTAFVFRAGNRDRSAWKVKLPNVAKTKIRQSQTKIRKNQT